MKIQLSHQPSAQLIQEMGIDTWPVWEKEASRFAWFYDSEETCLILEGKVTVIPEGGEPVDIVAGDLVTFPAGMSCVWHIHEDIRKRYHFA